MKSIADVDARDRERPTPSAAAARRSCSAPPSADSHMPASLVDGDHDPARQPFDHLKIEHDPVVAGLDQVEKVAGELTHLSLLDQRPCRAAGPR